MEINIYIKQNKVTKQKIFYYLFTLDQQPHDMDEYNDNYQTHEVNSVVGNMNCCNFDQLHHSTLDWMNCEANAEARKGDDD
jgi:hypothetical protein